jgi:hypothetical protein
MYRAFSTTIRPAIAKDSVVANGLNDQCQDTSLKRRIPATAISHPYPINAAKPRFVPCSGGFFFELFVTIAIPYRKNEQKMSSIKPAPHDRNCR